ncbi:MAG: CoB--CoM heterodisulfide reductase iron-sulfur subunit B family protein [Anaerolineae bacterium]|nr:CoB--CoM heterodisulfide reductase iron-sulfur subunit B family protein [Anaerolineae bacterium]
MTQSYGYYPGCSLQSSAREYDLSTRAVCRQLDIQLVEMTGWNCCGAVPAAQADPVLSGALVVRNLLLAGRAGQTVVMAPCSGCYKYFRVARQAVLDDAHVRQRVEYLVDASLPNPLPAVEHPLQVLSRDLGRVQQAVSRPLAGLRVACYYGCVIGRPRGGFDDPENPTSMDRLMAALGAEPVPYDYKTRCCGGRLAVPRLGTALDLTGHLLRKAKEQGADCLALACPLCATMLDTYQGAAGRAASRHFDLPVLYFTQLVGLAFGLQPRVLGLQHNVVSPAALLAALAITMETEAAS